MDKTREWNYTATETRRLNNQTRKTISSERKRHDIRERIREGEREVTGGDLVGR